MDKFPFPLPDFEAGWVWLAGAGPGDPGLVTLHTLNALQQADVIVYDALVGEPILKLARADAELEYAGKRGGRPSPKQRDISLRLIELARQGRRVLRLKGGDPLIFGRGAEEGLALADAGIPFKILPGISASIGGLAYAGIPLTHRDTNSAVTFLTGHGAGGNLPETVDWSALAKSSPVIVLYMALTNLAEVAGALIRAGRAADEPVAIVSNATLPNQVVIETTLGQAGVAAQRAEPPALAVIGEVVRLRTRLQPPGGGG